MERCRHHVQSLMCLEFTVIGSRLYAEEAKDQGGRVVVLTYPFWQRAFGGDPRILGQQITISARSYTVIGVMPPGWKFPIEDEHIDYVIPLQCLVRFCVDKSRLAFPQRGWPVETGGADTTGGSGAKRDRRTAVEAMLTRYEFHVDGRCHAAFRCGRGCAPRVDHPARRGRARSADRLRERSPIFYWRAPRRAAVKLRCTALGASRLRVIRQLLLVLARVSANVRSRSTFISTTGGSSSLLRSKQFSNIRR